MPATAPRNRASSRKIRPSTLCYAVSPRCHAASASHQSAPPPASPLEGHTQPTLPRARPSRRQGCFQTTRLSWRLEAPDVLVDVVVPPVVDRLVTMPGVDEVLLSADRVTVNVEDGAKWDAAGPQVSQIVSEALQAGRRRYQSRHSMPCARSPARRTRRARPARGQRAASRLRSATCFRRTSDRMREDGGDLRFIGFAHERGAARVQLVGACSGCPSSASTLKGRVEKLLQHFVPEVECVEAVADEEVAEMNMKAAEAGGSGGGVVEEGFGEEKVSLEEHIRRLLEAGANESVEWKDAPRRSVGRRRGVA